MVGATSSVEEIPGLQLQQPEVSAPAARDVNQGEGTFSRSSRFSSSSRFSASHPASTVKLLEKLLQDGPSQAAGLGEMEEHLWKIKPRTLGGLWEALCCS